MGEVLMIPKIPLKYLLSRYKVFGFFLIAIIFRNIQDNKASPKTLLACLWSLSSRAG